MRPARSDTAPRRSFGDVTYLILTSAAAFAIAAAWIRRDPGGWGLIGAGLACSAGGDLYFQFEVDAVAGPYPSLADALYYAFYPLAIAGVLTLGRRAWRSSYSFLPLLTPLLGLATVWSWLVYDPVVGTLEGSTASRVVTIGYPTLDLLLICAVLMAPRDARVAGSTGAVAAAGRCGDHRDRRLGLRAAGRERLRRRPDRDRLALADRHRADGRGRMAPFPAGDDEPSAEPVFSIWPLPSRRSRSRSRC